MSKQMKRAVVGFFGVLCVLVLISTFILGVNLIKNRWHKLDFSVESINVVTLGKSDGKTKYRVTVNGDVQTWFYDFNTYKFDMVYNSGGESAAFNMQGGSGFVAKHGEPTAFSFTFDTYSTDDIGQYVFRGKNIYISGDSKEATEIKLFLSEHTDKIVIDN